MTDEDLAELLRRWFDRGHEADYSEAYRILSARLSPTREVVQVLGTGIAEEIRHELLIRLLDLKTGALRGTQEPIRYIRRSWQTALNGELRKWGPRALQEPEVGRHLELIAGTPVGEKVDAAIDAKRALTIAEGLHRAGRLAVLLTTSPNRITDKDWAEIVQGLPPPPPKRPDRPLDRNEASLLLYPPGKTETKDQQYQRLNSFDRAFKRAADQIRQALDET